MQSDIQYKFQIYNFRSLHCNNRIADKKLTDKNVLKVIMTYIHIVQGANNT